jgi:antitoxin (DNA-binding transcriptional repressor) of toxin-antitoxin stability system
MHQVNVFQAKTELSKLISSLEKGVDDEIVIARNGKPVARLLRWEENETKFRIGVAKGKFRLPEDFDADSDTIEGMFTTVTL